VTAAWGLLGDDTQTAVIEMAAASGLALVSPNRRNPLLTTTYGTGELIRAAIDAGAQRLIVGIGGSATNDGGAGAAQALGVRFLDSDGQAILAPMTGGRLGDITHIETKGIQGLPSSILVACDVDNPLCGPRGAAAVYGPQKGATPEQVEILDRNLARLADIIERDLGKNVRDFPGAGAAGGLGAGLVAFLDARLDRGIRIVMEAVHFEERIRGADLIITGEGRIDRQSMMGKVIAGVGRAGKAAGVPVVALVGCVGDGADATLEVLQGFHAIHPPGTPLSEALARTPEALASNAANLIKRFV
jgi:glycerate kinase